MFTNFQGQRGTFFVSVTFLENAHPGVGDEVLSGWDLQQRYDQARRHQTGLIPGHRRPPALEKSGRKISPPAKSGEKVDLLTALASDCREQ